MSKWNPLYWIFKAIIGIMNFFERLQNIQEEQLLKIAILEKQVYGVAPKVKELHGLEKHEAEIRKAKLKRRNPELYAELEETFKDEIKDAAND